MTQTTERRGIVDAVALAILSGVILLAGFIIAYKPRVWIVISRAENGDCLTKSWVSRKNGVMLVAPLDPKTCKEVDLRKALEASGLATGGRLRDAHRPLERDKAVF